MHSNILIALFTAYTVFYIVGLVLSMQIPFVGFQPIRTSEHMAAAGENQYIHVVASTSLVMSLCVRHMRVCIDLRKKNVHITLNVYTIIAPVLIEY